MASGRNAWIVPVVIAGGLAGLVTALGLRKVRLALYAEWRSRPRVRVGEGAPVSKRRVKRALDFWKPLFPLGFGGLEMGGEPVPREGGILVTGRGQAFGESHAGLTTRTERASTREFLHAVVQVPAEYLDEDDPTLEHEIGHALGFGHEAVGKRGRPTIFGLPRGHLMAPDLDRAGWRTDGLRDALVEGVS